MRRKKWCYDFQSDLVRGLQPRKQLNGGLTDLSHLKILLYLNDIFKEGEKRKQETAKRRQNVIKS